MPTALIVEDEPEANKLLALLVQLRGYSTVSAFTGGEALEKVRSGPPDIVFLDLMLPDINGYEVCRQLKSGKSTSLIPVVVVTARVAAENRQESFCLGADDYIPKPYTPDQIFQAMEDADAWRQEVARNGFGRQASVVFGVDSDDALRELAHLRNFLVARTALDVQSVCRMGDALQALRTSAEAWGRAHALDPPASLSYHVMSDRIVFVVEDRGRWLTHSRRSPGERWPEAVSAAGFDTIEYAGDDCRLLLARRLAPTSPPGPEC